jgi:hypothetical protein
MGDILTASRRFRAIADMGRTCSLPDPVANDPERTIAAPFCCVAQHRVIR